MSDRSHSGSGQEQKNGTPHPPELEYVFTIRADIGPVISHGGHSQGERLHIPILGGTVTGPRLTGRIIPGGSDWPLIRPDGASQISARYTIIADDGTPIYVINEGLRVSSAKVLERLRVGEAVAPSEYYFRSAPRFDAPDGPHQWLRDRLFVAVLEPQGPTIHIDIFCLI